MKAILMKISLSTILRGAALVLALLASDARAFSLLGPYTSWQVNSLGYNRVGDIGGPMTLHEGFRWNVPTITYAFDSSFIKYFGPDGVRAANEAIAYFNDLDPANKISADLDEYSTSTLRYNYEAQALGLIDLKSTIMGMMMEELGFAEPVRYTFTLRNSTVTTVDMVARTNYSTIMLNYDPVSLQLSPYVNGTLYTFENVEIQGPPLDYADAREIAINQSAGEEFASLPVANGSVAAGTFFTGLTRDDVGGLRFHLNPNNFAVESLLPSVSAGGASSGSGGWIPFIGITNATTVTNLVFQTGSSTNFVVTGLRGGRNKIKFKQVRFDSLIGSGFTAITNSYTDTTVTNFTAVIQQVQRAITQPDILFVADDLGLSTDNLTPFPASRTGTGNWIDNDLLNGSDTTGSTRGPGVIPPQVRLTFTDRYPYFITANLNGEVPGEDTAFSGTFLPARAWGFFDGSTNPPIVFSATGPVPLQDLRQKVLHPTPVP